MKKHIPLTIMLFIILSSARSLPGYFTPNQLKEISQFKQPLPIPTQLPQGYVLKQFSLNHQGTKPAYQIDYRCFCAGQNLSFSIVGSTKPFDLTLASKLEVIETKVGPLKLGIYPAAPHNGLKKPFHMTHWFGQGKLKHTVITGLTDNPAPHQDIVYVLKHLEYVNATDK